MRWLVSITDSMDVNWLEIWEMMEDREPGMLQFTMSQTLRHDLVTGQQQLPPPEQEAVGSKHAAMSSHLNSVSDFPCPT